VLLLDGAFGTEFQKLDLDASDFGGFEGCNDILSVTRPDVVRDIYESYLAAGSDCITTNTFGVNLSALADYGLEERAGELAAAAARIARECADAYSTEEQPRFVLGDLGPGSKLPTLGQVGFAELRDTYEVVSTSLIASGVDAIIVETVQDPLQAKAAVMGAKRARRAAGRVVPIFLSVTVETNGALLLGSQVSAIVAMFVPLRVDAIGLNCATGPNHMGEHLAVLASQSPTMLLCQPNAGLPVLGPDGATYPLTPDEYVRAMMSFVDRFGLNMVGGCCGTSPEHIRALREALGRRAPAPRQVNFAPSLASLYEDVATHQDINYLAIGERANAAGSKAFREAMLAGDYDACLELARKQTGVHLVDLCVDYVGRDATRDAAELASRFATGLTAPLSLDSSVPLVLQTELERYPGRPLVNSVHLEDGDGPGSKYEQVMSLVAEHGAAVVALTIDEDGMARTAERKLSVAERLIGDITGRWDVDEGSLFVDFLTYPITTGSSDNRRDAMETIAAISQLASRHPGVKTILGVSNISFGIKPRARVVLNSVFLYEARKAGLSAAIVDAGKIMPVEAIREDVLACAEDLIWDRRTPDYDPLTAFLAFFDDDALSDAVGSSQEPTLADLPVDERLRRRIISGNADELAADLDEALAQGRSALDIINTELLDGMREVGELFGAGKMQLPFVLGSAEVMKKAVTLLEPHLDRSDASSSKGTLVLATVRGDVHDIGKNLVDIIVSNNGYRVVNLGIKQSIEAIISAAVESHADAIGMSGLLVKSTQIMRDNLAEIAARGLADDYPVLLGGAALTRSYVEDILAVEHPGVVRYSTDAFAGLRQLDEIMAAKTSSGETGSSLPTIPAALALAGTPTLLDALVDPSTPTPQTSALRGASQTPQSPQESATEPYTTREPFPDTHPDRPEEPLSHDTVPTPPFWGTRTLSDIPLDEVLPYLDYKALLLGRWGLRAPDGLEALVASQQARIDGYLSKITSEHLDHLRLVYGYWPVYTKYNAVVLLDPADQRTPIGEFVFPRQVRAPNRSVSDYFRTQAECDRLGPDVLPLQVVTVGRPLLQAADALNAAGEYRAYFELHGVAVQLAEALAEYWHAHIRAELGISASDGDVSQILAKQQYQGERFSFGYAACPDLEQRRLLVDLTGATSIGITLTEALQLDPEASTDALIVHHPKARYFSVR
jgi:5-methyltetrahydrofolate--homocysteine methyltransferase